MSEKLKLCPFCRGLPTVCVCDGTGTVWTKDVETKVLWGHKMTHYMIVCQKCGIKTKPYLTRRGLLRMWNRRFDDVVHCKDCEKYKERRFPDGQCYGWFCQETHYGRNPDDFCSYGVRKE